MLIFGSIFIIAGAVIFLMSIDIFHVPDENFNVPRWVVAIVGMVFSLAGALAILNGLKSGFGYLPLYKWVYNGLLLVFMVLFAIPAHWVAFGSGERSFESTKSFGAVSASQGGGGESSGRLVFGIGAILMDVIILYILYGIFQGKNLSKGE